MATEKLDQLGVDALCDRICAGESQVEIAQDIGVGIATLSRWIAADVERSARVREARISAARTYADMAEKQLKDATDPFGLAKAREIASHYRWKASKANPREYGDKVQQEVSGPNGGPVQVTQIQLIPMHDSRTDRDTE